MRAGRRHRRRRRRRAVRAARRGRRGSRRLRRPRREGGRLAARAYQAGELSLDRNDLRAVLADLGVTLRHARRSTTADAWATLTGAVRRHPLHAHARRHVQGRVLPRRGPARRPRRARRPAAADHGQPRPARRSTASAARIRSPARSRSSRASTEPGIDVDYLFLQVGVDRARRQRRADLRQPPRRGRARSPSSAGSSPPTAIRRRVRIRLVNTGDVATAVFPDAGRAPRLRRRRRDRRRARHRGADRAGDVAAAIGRCCRPATSPTRSPGTA